VPFGIRRFMRSRTGAVRLPRSHQNHRVPAVSPAVPLPSFRAAPPSQPSGGVCLTQRTRWGEWITCSALRRASTATMASA